MGTSLVGATDTADAMQAGHLQVPVADRPETVKTETTVLSRSSDFSTSKTVELEFACASGGSPPVPSVPVSRLVDDPGSPCKIPRDSAIFLVPEFPDGVECRNAGRST